MLKTILRQHFEIKYLINIIVVKHISINFYLNILKKEEKKTALEQEKIDKQIQNI